MDRRELARETLEILRRGYYEPAGEKEAGRIVIKDAVEFSVRHSTLITPAEGQKLLEKYKADPGGSRPETQVENLSTVEAIRILAAEGKTAVGVLNFASARNPGGGFLNGAKAQEETLTISSALYPTLTAHEEYYRENRAQRSMMYLDYGIYSPEVLFFRDEALHLTGTPVKASVLT